jgi:hypothetical protein
MLIVILCFYIELIDYLIGIDFFAYFERTWIGTLINRNRCLNPLFAIEMWNNHQLTVDQLPRTTSPVEATNRTFQQTIGIDHPPIYRLTKR